MNILELLYDLFCWINYYNGDDFEYILYDFMKKEDLLNYEDEVKTLIEQNIMTTTDYEILEKRIEKISNDVGRLVRIAERNHGSIVKLESELRILLTRYKFSQNYINHFVNEFMEFYKEEH